MDAISSNASTRRYERDLLLQLRLHPFSLQKPEKLKNQDIVKDKLYLYQIDDCPGSQNGNLSSSRSACQTSIKPDTDVMFRSHRLFPECYPRSCPLYVPGYKYNSGYHGVSSSKSRPFYMTDCINPVRKWSGPTTPEYDLSFEDIFSPTWPGSQTVPWSKQGSYDEVWNSYNRPLRNSTSNDHLEAPVKNKKALPIIDPENGKNILEGILNSPSVSQESAEETDSNTKSRGVSSESEDTACDIHEEDTVNKTQTNGNPQNTSSVEEFSTPQTIMRTDEAQDVLIFNGEDGCSEDVQGHGLDSSKEEAKKSIHDSSTKKPQLDYGINFDYNNCEESVAVNIPNTDTENRYCQTLPLSDRNNRFLSLGDGTMRTDDQFKANAAIMREKLYLKQEQQKMLIFQNYLRFKKQQLDEMLRNLDDQRIEITTWKYNLACKDKRLKKKEDELLAREKKLASDRIAAGQSEAAEVRNVTDPKDADSKDDPASCQVLHENGIDEPEVDAESLSDEVNVRSMNGVMCNGIGSKKHRPDYSCEYKR